MEENKYTDLDKLFKDRLNKADQDDTTWNLPSDDVFEGAISQVHDGQRRRRAILWILAGLILLLTVGAFLFNAQKVNELEKALAYSQAQLMESQMAMAELKKENEAASAESLINASSTGGKEDEIMTKVDPIKSGMVQNGAFSEATTKAVSSAQVDIAEATNPTTVDQKSHSIMDAQERKRVTSSLMPLLSPLYVQIGHDVEHQLSGPAMIDDIEKESRFEWYIGATSNWTTLEMKGIKDGTASLTEYDKRYLGYGIRTGILQDLPGRWSVDYRLSYQHFTNKSAFMDALIYDDDLETTGVNGTTSYAMDLSILSPMSELNRGLAFEVDGFPIADEDVFENVTKISEEYNWWTLAVIPKVDVIASPKWSLSAGLGLQANYLMTMKEDMDVKLYFESEMMKNEVIQTDPSKNVNPWSLSALGELTLSHELTERAAVSLTAGMQQSITPINTPLNGVSPRTYVNDLQLGLNFNLKI